MKTRNTILITLGFVLAFSFGLLVQRAYAADVTLSVVVQSVDVARVKAALQTHFAPEEPYTNAELKAKIETVFWLELQKIVAGVEAQTAGSAASQDVYDNLLPG